MLVRIRKADLEKAGILFSPNTLYKWRSIGRHPELFVEISNRVFVDSDEWDKAVAKSKQETKAKIEKLKQKEKLANE